MNTLFKRKALDFKSFLCFRQIIGIFFMLILLSVSSKVYSQVVEAEEEIPIEEQVFLMVEVPPSFPGGDKARNEFLRKNLVYPDKERDNGIQGLVVVNFIVEKDGSLSNLKVLKGVTPAMNDEAVRVIKAMPKWTPGLQRGKPMRVSINLPLRFTLADEKVKDSKKQKEKKK
ncbi:MAG: energy transducer TonB [Bacteroidetes bacterium]|jgi:protein TonB|nr:energy transducer TonB [Bacteroidota bacterium]MBT5529232.1 energy transducer TonB [Cytophagia bacterium]MBT3799944.1 energy transducer TonB [Bacteroidota bacterium]MBT3932798.1 energy transducer TonB [Bacteroidota bacterium]MBT4730018.1 energy transducer TonB [Bacteroidota bacterium]